MASTVIKNWDNKTWLSSQNYIKSFNNFLIKNIKVNSSSKILDIGCGRGKILGALSSKLRLKKKPLGIDIVNHKDRDKRINFKKMNILNLSLRKDQRFDLILIKQTIHLIKFSEIKRLIKSDGVKINDKLFKNNDLSLKEYAELKEIKIAVGKKKIGILKII